MFIANIYKHSAGKNAHNNQFCDILAPRCDTNPCLEVLSNLSAFCKTFDFENQSISKHFTGTFVIIKQYFQQKVKFFLSIWKYLIIPRN